MEDEDDQRLKELELCSSSDEGTRQLKRINSKNNQPFVLGNKRTFPHSDPARGIEYSGIRGLFYSGIRYFDITTVGINYVVFLNYWFLVFRHEFLCICSHVNAC